MVKNVIKNLLKNNIEKYGVEIVDAYPENGVNSGKIYAFVHCPEVKRQDTIVNPDGQKRIDMVGLSVKVELVGEGLSEILYRNIATAISQVSSFSNFNALPLCPSKISHLMSGMIKFDYVYTNTYAYSQKSGEMLFLWHDIYGICENFSLSCEINQTKIHLTDGNVILKSPVLVGKKLEMCGKIHISKLDEFVSGVTSAPATSSDITIKDKIYTLKHLTDFKIVKKNNFTAEFKMAGYAE